MKGTYKTSGTFSRSIDVEIEDGIVKNVKFNGGCMGNTQGIAALVKDMEVDEVIRRCKGIKCGMRNTSCPDQLAAALEKYKNK